MVESWILHAMIRTVSCCYKQMCLDMLIFCTFDGQKVLYNRRARRSKVPVAVFLIGHVSNVKPYTVVNLIIFQP